MIIMTLKKPTGGVFRSMRKLVGNGAPMKLEGQDVLAWGEGVLACVTLNEEHGADGVYELTASEENLLKNDPVDLSVDDDGSLVVRQDCGSKGERVVTHPACEEAHDISMPALDDHEALVVAAPMYMRRAMYLLDSAGCDRMTIDLYSKPDQNRNPVSWRVEDKVDERTVTLPFRVSGVNPGYGIKDVSVTVSPIVREWAVDGI